MFRKIIFFIIICTLSQCFGAKILGIFPSPAFSHQLVHRTLMKELHSRGHEITVLTTDPVRKNSSIKGYKEIDLHFLYNYINKSRYTNAVQINRLIGLVEIMYGLHLLAKDIFNLKEVKYLIENESFDLVILEWSNDASFTAFSEHFNCPLIGIRSLNLKVEAHDAIANPVTPSYISVAFMNQSSDFFGRLLNSFMVFFIRFVHQWIFLPLAEETAKKNFPKHNIHVRELEKSVSLIFSYTHPVLNGVRPLVPANVEIGGMHLENHKQEIPQELHKFLNDSIQGVIVFSLGTMVSSESINDNKIKILMDTFKELPFNVLIKLEKVPSGKTLKNVKILKWFPQQSVLGHPNVRLFISHTGILSTWEAIMNHVPIIACPFHSDQFHNAQRIEELGIGIQFDFHSLTKNKLLKTVNEVMGNSSYKKRIKEVANLLRDQPIKPLEKAVWWTEYVLRHNGTPHFTSKAVNIHWSIYYSLDVISFIILLIIITIYMVYKILKLILKSRKCKSRNNNKKIK